MSGKKILRHHHGVTRAETLCLKDALNGKIERAEKFLDAFLFEALDHADIIDARVFQRADDPQQHGLSEYGRERFGLVGLHPLALASRENNGAVTHTLPTLILVVTKDEQKRNHAHDSRFVTL